MSYATASYMIKEKKDIMTGNGSVKTLQFAQMLSTLLLGLVVPLCSVCAEFVILKRPFDPQMIARWFIFWGFGVQLLLTGIVQVWNPGFTALRIYQVRNVKSFTLIRQLGIVSIAAGAAGIFSLFDSNARVTAAFSACLFSGMATIWHFSGNRGSRSEIIQVVTDLLQFSVILLYLFFIMFP